MPTYLTRMFQDPLIVSLISHHDSRTSCRAGLVVPSGIDASKVERSSITDWVYSEPKMNANGRIRLCEDQQLATGEENVRLDNDCDLD